MADIKQAGFSLLILLVAVSGIYEWAAAEPLLNTQLGIDEVTPFTSTEFEDQVTNIDPSTTDDVEIGVKSNPKGWIDLVAAMFLDFLPSILPMLFGWINLIESIFAAAGIGGNLHIVFTAPIAVIQILMILYFTIDVALALRKLLPIP